LFPRPGRVERRSALKSFWIAAGATIVFLAYVFVERRLHDARLKRIPLRIAVTGTRGKSTVTRLVAGILRESGLSVLAKTTGSKAVILYPDGTEEEIRRRGVPSILEQKRIVRLAARSGAGAVVVEMMSIREECLFVESRRLLKPGILVLTNVRLDHLEWMGSTRDEIARCLSAAFPKGGTVILPEEETADVFVSRAAVLGSALKLAAKLPEEGADLAKIGGGGTFEENVRLALAVARLVGVPLETACRGMAAAAADFGTFKAWRAPGRGESEGLIFASAFAANDPESTLKAIAPARAYASRTGKRMVGLLNLRPDRGDRSIQWADALESGRLDDFAAIAVIGSPARAFGARIKRTKSGNGPTILVLREKGPLKILGRLASAGGSSSVVVGMGNIRGLGGEIVAHWERTGIPHGL
jgi:gamma-polyglutamate synthase